MSVSLRLEDIRKRIERARQSPRRPPQAGHVRLVCVTKGVSEHDIKKALAAGVSDIGENRVREASLKRNLLAASADSVAWHLIGHLQTNKAARAVSIFDLIQSVDSERLASCLDARAAAAGKIQNILVEIKISGETSKTGCSPAAADDLARKIVSMKNLRLCGLMAMSPYFDDTEESRPYFARAGKIYQDLRGFFAAPNPWSPVPVLSMGMSQDFEVAIEEGANMVRIGTEIFKGREADEAAG